ncbi:hypothetical protein ACRAWD_02855 [Caulobacter segnis]
MTGLFSAFSDPGRLRRGGGPQPGPPGHDRSRRRAPLARLEAQRLNFFEDGMAGVPGVEAPPREAGAGTRGRIRGDHCDDDPGKALAGERGRPGPSGPAPCRQQPGSGPSTCPPRGAASAPSRTSPRQAGPAGPSAPADGPGRCPRPGLGRDDGRPRRPAQTGSRRAGPWDRLRQQAAIVVLRQTEHATPASAMPSRPRPTALDTVVVTARKARGKRPRRPPISLTAFSSQRHRAPIAWKACATSRA